MSRSAKVTLDWADGTYLFQLPIEQLDELEEKTGQGLPVILRSLVGGSYTRKMVTEPIRLGLIGGGMEPVAALNLVRRYAFPPRPLVESVLTAQAVLSAALVGVEDAEDAGLGETQGEGDQPVEPSPTSAPTGARSTAKAPPSASGRPPSGGSASGSSPPP